MEERRFIRDVGFRKSVCVGFGTLRYFATLRLTASGQVSLCAIYGVLDSVPGVLLMCFLRAGR